MIVDSVLTNAKAYLGGQIVDCSIAIEEGKIQKIGKETQMPQADEKTDLQNLLVLPGLIDEHVHLRDEGKAYKEDFASGTAAAAAGGFTTVLDMPNNDPVTMSVETLRNRMRVAQRKLLINVGFYSEFPKKLPEVQGIVSEGAVGFKLFMGCQIGGLNIGDDQALQEAFKEVANLKVPIAVHAEDQASLTANEEKLKQAKKTGTADFLRAHTETVELKAIQRLLKISAQTDVRLHFCHVSTQEGLNAISEAKKSGRTVTCEVTPNHLLLSSDDLKRYGQMVIMAPPLRSKPHVDALWKGIEDGSVDAIGSDHAPHAQSEKSASNIWAVKVGVPGLETTLPLMLTLVKKNRLTVTQVVQLLAEKPAEIYGLNDRGRLEQGKNADLTVVDFNCQFKIDASKFKSKAKYSPYDGWEVQGKPVKTIVNGQLVFDEDEIVAKAGSGLIVRRGSV
ncbi:MAG: dihydroorotase family protein [Chloroflexi bacterium]|nr:dihydroorotase family protein [Chloroflexota bacterium]MCL5948905.1 dihydroorotase family protein [Candidatus Bathyarchaeota archaeon]